MSDNNEASTIQISITVPINLFNTMEDLRYRADRNRSSHIANALRHYHKFVRRQSIHEYLSSCTDVEIELLKETLKKGNH
jgi:metal-responsive CopG/Arc/MetJ family transcriptional regulator